MLKHWILLFVTAHTVFSQQCPSGYSLDTSNNRCFKVSTDIQNYVGAMTDCNRDGGFLATIENGFINWFVGSLNGMESGKSWIYEYSHGQGYRYKFENYPNAATTFRAFVCKKPALP